MTLICRRCLFQKRVIVRKNNYFYAPIDDTPFRSVTKCTNNGLIVIGIIIITLIFSDSSSSSSSNVGSGGICTSSILSNELMNVVCNQLRQRIQAFKMWALEGFKSFVDAL